MTNSKPTAASNPGAGTVPLLHNRNVVSAVRIIPHGTRNLRLCLSMADRVHLKKTAYVRRNDLGLSLADTRDPTMPAKLKPIHYGEVLKHDFLDPMGITAYRLAKQTGVSAQHIRRIVMGTRGIGGDLALRLARYFGTTAQVWMGLQSQYELDVAEDRSGR